MTTGKPARSIGRNLMRIIGAAALLFICGCTCFSIPLMERDRELDETVVSGKGRDKILLMDISGTISSREKRGAISFRSEDSIVSRVREELTRAAEDSRIKGLIVRINSPGGTVTASDIIYTEIKRFKEEKKVPVVAAITELAASGGYYVAVAADTIVAHPTSVTGSIGVIAVKFNAQGLMEKIGVVDETFTAGDKKDLFSPMRPVTDEERDIIQGMLNSFHQRFKDLVLKGRPSLTAADIDRLADGRVYTADQALATKLVDEIGYLDDAIAVVKKGAGIKDARVIMYHRPWGYKNNIYSQLLGPEVENVNLINLDLSWLLGEAGLHFMYLWAP
jgi:protease-4